MKHCKFVLCVLLLAMAASATDWTQFRGPNGDGKSDEKGINKNWTAKPPKELWRFKLNDDGYAGISVADGKAYVIDHEIGDDVVRAIDVATGKEAWNYRYPDSEQANYGNARATPTFDNGKLYTLSRTGVLNCIDAAKGAKIWTKHLNNDLQGQTGGWQHAASPIVDGEKLIVCPGGAKGAVAALNKNTGEVIWRGGGTDEAGYATPVIATIEGRKQYVIFTGLALTGVEADKGGLLWRVRWETSYNVNAAMPVVVGNSIFISSGYGKGSGLVVVKDGKAALVWENKSITAHFNAPVVFDGYVYGSSGQAGSNGELKCLEFATGKLMWKGPPAETGGTIGVDGVLIALNGKTGDLYMVEINPKEYKELGHIKPLGGQSWTPPTISNGKLFIRNKKELACLDLK